MRPLSLFAATLSAFLMGVTGLAAQPYYGALQVPCAKPVALSFPNGVIPDSKAAILVALPILNAVYGEKNIANELPLKVRSWGDKYIVDGVLQGGPNMLGGNATMILCKSNGAVVFLSHSK